MESPIPAAKKANGEPRAVTERNFWLLTLYQVFMRTGWIFKTESIIMPAVLDTLTDSGFMRGALPLLNRIGQSLAPLAAAPYVKALPRKKGACFLTVSLMAISFAGMAGIWLWPEFVASRAAAYAYLTLYGVFFACLGVNSMCQFTLQAKLVPVERRGLLISWSNGAGSASAVLFALVLLPLWLREKSGDFASLFGFTSLLFAMAAGLMLLMRESPDRPQPAVAQASPPRFRTWSILRENAAFRHAAGVAFLYGTSAIVFPHYQALARDEFGLDLRRMLGWVVVQNIGTGLFSIPLGKLADRLGTRAVMRVVLLGVCLTPPVALAIARYSGGAAWAYNLVFLLIGLNPLALRFFSEYTLEISEPADHPHYLSAMSLSISLPILLSVPAGWAIERWGFTPVFSGVTGLLALSWLLTFSLPEPRHLRTIESQPLPEQE